MIQRVDLLLKLLGELGELVCQLAGIHCLMQLIEPFLDLLTTLTELVAQPAEITQLMKLAEKLAEITKVLRSAPVRLIGPIILTWIVRQHVLTRQMHGDLRQARQMDGLILVRRLQCDRG